EFGVTFRERGRTVGEEVVLRRAESLPQCLVGVLRSASRSLPFRHEFLVAAGGRAPVGGVGERFGFGEEFLFSFLRLRALFVEFREVGPAPAVEPFPSFRESFPPV